MTLGSDPGCLHAGLGERGVPAEEIGARAARELMDVIASGACTDEWLQVWTRGAA